MDAIMVAEDVQDSWTIEPNIDKEGMVETSPTLRGRRGCERCPGIE